MLLFEGLDRPQRMKLPVLKEERVSKHRIIALQGAVAEFKIPGTEACR
jgi:hypothetical protein